MDAKQLRTRLKEAKKSYQQKDYKTCHELIKEILENDPKNYNTIVLNGACCDQLELEDEGVDSFYDAIQLEPSNILAWQGLQQLGSKNADRFYETLVCCCINLLSFYTEPQFEEKRVSCARQLIELFVHYRLELPDCVDNLSELCRLVLKSCPSNTYALELWIRLQIEAFLVSGLPFLISPTLAQSSIPSYLDDWIKSDADDRLNSLADSLKDSPDLCSCTAMPTVAIGRLVSQIVAQKKAPDVPEQHGPFWRSILNGVERMELNGYVGLENWFKRHSMDFHACCVHALAAHKLGLTDRCEKSIRMVLAHCAHIESTVADEARHLSKFPTVPLSQLTDFLTPRPMCTPFRTRLSSPVKLDQIHNPYVVLHDWITVLRLANAAASERTEWANQIASDLNPQLCDKSQSFCWPSVIETLWFECCLVGDQLQRVTHYIIANDTEQIPPLDLITSNTWLNAVTELRGKLCRLWVAVEYRIRHHPSDIEALYDLVKATDALRGKLMEARSSRDHFLLARLFARLASMTDSPLCSVEVQLVHCLGGLEVDPLYYLNHSLAGQLHREAGRLRESLPLLLQAHKLMPSSPQVAYQLALLYCANDQLEKALNVYASVERKRFTKQMWLNFGLVAMRLGRSLQCVPALQEVIKADSRNALYWELLGEAYLQRGSFENAMKALNHSIQGLSGRAIEEFQTVLVYLDEVFGLVSPAPIWAYHFTGSAFSILSVIDDPDMRLQVPNRFLSILLSNESEESEMDSKVTTMPLSSGLRLASIYLASTLKHWMTNQSSLTGPAKTPHSESASCLAYARLSLTLALNCLTHAMQLVKYPSIADKSPVLSVDALRRLAESELKRLLSRVTDAAARDQLLLDQFEAQEEEECSTEVSRIAQLQASDAQMVRDRLRVNAMLRSQAWYGLAVLYASVDGDRETVINYCLCQALVAYSHNTEAGTSLAIRLLHQGRTQFANALLAHFQAADSDNHLVWLAAAQLHSITNNIHGSGVNLMVLQDLLQAACLGADVKVATHLTNHLFPLLIEAVRTSPVRTKHKVSDTGAFNRLAIDVTAEALNRALALEPRNPYLWHNRGILLQLAGLSAPAEYCMRRSLELFSHVTNGTDRSTHMLLASAQTFLLTYIRGNPDWSLADQLLSFAGEFNPTACASLAEALAKGIIFSHHPELSGRMDLTKTCFLDEPIRLSHQGSTAAIAISDTCPHIWQWLFELSRSSDQSNTDPSLIPTFKSILRGTPVLKCPPNLARCLSSRIVGGLCAQDPLLVGQLWKFSQTAQLTYEDDSLCAAAATGEIDAHQTGHVLCESGQITPVDHATWALDNAALSTWVSGSSSSGLAYLSRFIANRPDEPTRWTAMALWLVQHTLQPVKLDETQPDEKKTKSQEKKEYASRQRQFISSWCTMIRIVCIVLRLQAIHPVTQLFAHVLVQCTSLFLSSKSRDNIMTAHPDAVATLLSGLRRAAILHPHVPDVRSQLTLFTEFEKSLPIHVQN